MRIVGRPVSAHISVKHSTEGSLFMSRSRALSSATLEMNPKTLKCRMVNSSGPIAFGSLRSSRRCRASLDRGPRRRLRLDSSTASASEKFIHTNQGMEPVVEACGSAGCVISMCHCETATWGSADRGDVSLRVDQDTFSCNAFSRFCV